MSGQVNNFARFYGLLNRLPCINDDTKDTLVSSFTDGRTTHLSEMTVHEYNALCNSLEERTGYRNELRHKRALCLNLMQHAGVNTNDWTQINNFCKNPRIAGKVFSHLHLDDLEALHMKLRAIIGKGGLKNIDNQ